MLLSQTQFDFQAHALALVVHRDLKPSNVLISLDNPSKIKIIDFGFAALASTSEPATRKGNESILGTAAYGSRRAHLGRSTCFLLVSSLNHTLPGLSFRDDYDSLLYLLVCLYRGSLPWDEICCQLDEHPYLCQAIQYVKNEYSRTELFLDFPDSLVALYDAAFNLAPGQKADLAWMAIDSSAFVSQN
jgi:serine/threonine protein kinase